MRIHESIARLAILLCCSFITIDAQLAAIAIDLGTQFLKIGIVKPGIPMDIVLNSESRRKTPNVVMIQDGHRTFADAAVGLQARYPQLVHGQLNDLIAKSTGHPSFELFSRRNTFYAIDESPRNSSSINFKFGEDSYSVEALTAMILANAKKFTEEYAQVLEIKDVVLTVPVYFTPAQYLKSKHPTLTHETLFNILSQYVQIRLSKGYLKLSLDSGYFDEEEEENKFLHKILKNSNHKLIMYGSARELEEDLKVFRNFPGSDRFFKTPLLLMYNSAPTLYQSLKDEKYILKSDIFIIIQNIIHQNIPLSSSKNPIVRAMISIFLKSSEKQLGDKLEFVKFDSKEFDGIVLEIQQYINPLLYNKKYVQKLKRETIGNVSIYEKLKELLPNTSSPEELDAIREIDFFSNICFADLLPMAYAHTKIIITCLQQVIKKRSEMFLPYSETDSTKPMTVRLFEVGTEKFVMKDELHSVIRKFSKDLNLIDYENGPDVFMTIKLEDVFSKFGDHTENIEFIRTPIIKAKLKPVPIKSPKPGGFCILGVDALLFALKAIIFAGQFFQRCTLLQFKCVEKLIEAHTFNFESSGLYFVNYDILQFWFDEDNLWVPQKVTNEKDDRITVQDVRNELNYLKLDNFFPKINDNAENVYKEVMRLKKGKYLRMCDLFDVIEHCLIVCIFDRLPSKKKFLHLQQGCRRVLGMKCAECETEKKLESSVKKETSEHLKTISSNSANSEKDEKSPQINEAQDQPMKSISFKEEKIPRKEISNEQVSIREHLNNCEPTARHIAINEISAPVNETSKSCEKCYETSEMLTETKKELKTSQNKLKKLETISSNGANSEKDEKSPQINEAQDQSMKSISFKEKKIPRKEISNEKVSIREHLNNCDPTAPVNENSKSCEKCYETSEMLTETKKELKTSQNKLKKLEKKINEMEIQLVKEKEMNTKQINETESVKSEKHKEIQDLIIQRTNILEIQTSLSEAVASLEEDLCSEKSKNRSLEESLQEASNKLSTVRDLADQRLLEEKRGFKEELNKMSQQIYDLHATNGRLRAENEVNQKTMEHLFRKLSSVTTAGNGNSLSMSHHPHSITPLNSSITPLSSSTAPPNICSICLLVVKTTDNMIKCHTCKYPFHSNCASNWLRLRKWCPACQREFFVPSSKSRSFR